ncbi:MAG: DUF2270 domain-containing protein [Anaerolineae bacterium]|jgi:uncharacterized membrane protein
MNDQERGPGGSDAGPTWSFRGYKLDAAHFTTAMVHLYRAEVTRANVWRTRLDATTNWAVISVGAALSLAFGSPQNPHFVLLLELLLVLNFLYIESRRNRYYQLWSYRVHLMETNFFAAMLAPPFRPAPDWADYLVDTLLDPEYPMPRWQAIGLRFRRNYFWMVSLLLVSWGAKLALHPVPVSQVSEVIDRAAIGPVKGWLVVLVVTLGFLVLIGLGVLSSIPRSWRASVPEPDRPVPAVLQRLRSPVSIGSRLGKERLATIVTSKGPQLATRLIEELGRGVTKLNGVGAYTGESRDVLLCAATAVQIPKLREIVQEIDPQAFFIVSAAEEVRGGGFRSFEAPS